MGAMMGKPVKAFILQQGALVPGEELPPCMDTRLDHIIVGLPRRNLLGKICLSYIAKTIEEVAIMGSFQWKDGRAIFDSTTRQLRLIQDMSSTIHMNVQKWSRYTIWKPNPTTMWKKIWLSYLPEKNHMFCQAGDVSFCIYK